MKNVIVKCYIFVEKMIQLKMPQIQICCIIHEELESINKHHPTLTTHRPRWMHY